MLKIPSTADAVVPELVASVSRRVPTSHCQLFSQSKRLPPFAYCASIQLSEPVSLTATSEMKMCSGLPSAVPRCSVENRIGPAFL